MDSVVKALDDLVSAATPSKSVADAIANLDGLVVSDGAAAVAAALEADGDITKAIEGSLEDALKPAGDITEAIGGAIEAGIDDDPKGDIYEMAETVAAAECAKHVAAYQADSEATEVAGLVADFNTLLAKLVAAGLMADDD